MKKRKIVLGVGCVLAILLIAGCILGAIFFLKKGQEEKELQEQPTLVGVKDLQVEVGESLPDLKAGIKKSENVTKVEVDATEVDTKTAGEYPIIYRYTDTEGKSYQKEAKVTVTEGTKQGDDTEKDMENTKEPEKMEPQEPQEPKESQVAVPKTGDAFVAKVLAASLGVMVSGGIIVLCLLPKKRRRI